MSTTVLYEDTATTTTETPRPEGEDLWIPAAELPTVSAWELKPEGMCRDEICVPVPPDRAPSLVQRRDGGSWVNLAEFARYMGQPYAHDARGSVWSFGTAPGDRQAARETLEAPDFALSDLGGTVHRLSDHRGKKVLLALWASW